MRTEVSSGLKSRLASGIAGAALAFAIPSSVWAVGLLEGETSAASNSFATFTPASGDPRLAEMIASTTDGKARMMRFTPAGARERNDRSVTVAVRIDEEAAQAISVRSAIESAREPFAGETGSRIAATRYNLGLARGYRSFAQAPALSEPLSTATIPDLAQFAPAEERRDQPARFVARIELEEERPAGRTAAKTLDSAVDQSLDVVGSYRLTNNLDVTAGVRYQQDRDRLAALPDIEQQDSQAVYIGTQFRF